MVCPNCQQTEMTAIDDLFDIGSGLAVNHCGECGTIEHLGSHYAPRRFEIAKTAPVSETE